jgi:aldehyde dehydrogenase (NAD+)
MPQWDKLSPLDGASLGVVEATTPSEVSAMVVTARDAQLAWQNLGLTARGKIIRRAAEELALETDALARLVREETGKQSSLAHGELAAAIEMAEMMAAYGRFASGALFPSAIPGRQIRVERVPHGVAALIVAFNTPLPNYAWKVFPALMAGNSAILKPSPHTPLSAQLFVDVLHRSGVPHGVLQIAQGGAETAQALVTGDVNLVSFTGSYDAGVAVSEAAAGSLKKIILELGGSNPLIVCDDANIAQAVTTALQSAYSNAGQRCAAGSRILVNEKVYEAFRSEFLQQSDSWTWGTSDDVLVSTLVDSESAKKVEKYLTACEAGGAVVHRLGKGVNDSSPSTALVQPALVEGLDAKSDLGLQEIFAPVARLFSFSTDEQAIDIVSASPYGLTAAVWTRDINRAERMVGALPAGVVSINGPTHGAEINIPFGGMKSSGNGTRDAGVQAIEEYSQLRTISTFFEA